MSQHTTPAHNVIVQIKVKLLGVSKPPVWRQLQLRADTRLDQLHEILQAALDWENYHITCSPSATRSSAPRTSTTNSRSAAPATEAPANRTR